MKTTHKESPKVRSVSNALAVLRRLAESTHRPEGVSAIARNVNMSPSSCFNILKTLTAEGFVLFDSEMKTYTLGAGAVDLAVAALDPEADFPRTRHILEGIARDFGVTCGLWHRVGDRLILLGAVEGQEITRIRFSAGVRIPSRIGAMGRCIAAFDGIAEDEIARYLPTLKWDSPPKLKRYLTEVKTAAVNGFAIDEGNFFHGVSSVAAPIIGREGTVTHCMAATTFKGRYDVEGLRTLGRVLIDACETARTLLGGAR